jgi:hypothetical protein
VPNSSALESRGSQYYLRIPALVKVKPLHRFVHLPITLAVRIVRASGFLIRSHLRIQNPQRRAHHVTRSFLMTAAVGGDEFDPDVVTLAECSEPGQPSRS